MLIQRFPLFHEFDSDTDSTGLAIVAAACELLQNGTRTIDKLWPGDIPTESAILNDSDAFEKSQLDFWKLKRAARALDLLRTTLETKLYPFDRTVIPLSARHGIQKLPTEVLRQIIATYEQSMWNEKYYPVGPDGESVRELALVNRQFRDAVYDLPQCFSELGHEGSFIRNDDEYRARTLRRLSKCNFSNLRVYLRESPDIAIAEELHTEIVSLCVPITQDLLKFRPSSNLDKLKALAIYAGPEALDEEVFARFIPLIDTPSLMVLKVQSMGWLSYLRADMLSDLKVNDCNLWSEADMDELFSHLQSLTSLKRLSLQMHVNFDFDIDTHEAKDFNLMYLEHVEIRLNDWGYEEPIPINHGHCADFMAELLSSFKAPALQYFSLDFSRYETEFEDFWWQFSSSIPFSRKSLPSLRQVDFKFFSHDKAPTYSMIERADLFLSNVLIHCPTIEDVSCTLPNYEPSTGFDLFARRRRIHFYCDCDGLFYASLIENLLVGILTQEQLKLESISFGSNPGHDLIKLGPTFWNSRPNLKQSMPTHLKVLFS